VPRNAGWKHGKRICCRWRITTWCLPCRRRSALIAYTNKALIYRLLFEVAAETLRTIAGDARHLGAQIGVTLVLHTWGSALTHHPHVHGIVPGGGLSADGERWVACKPGFFLPVRVLSRLFRRRFLEELTKAHGAGQLHFFGEFAGLADAAAFADWLTPLRRCEWVVYAKRPFAGPQAVLAYLSRYTHRVAISNQRLVAMDERGITFRWKDYRSKERARLKTMTLSPAEFMRRFLLHVLPGGFHRIRHFGLLANGGRRENLAKVRALLQVANRGRLPETADAEVHPQHWLQPTVRLPGVRGGHGHHRDLGPWATDPRTALAAGNFMNDTRPIFSINVHWFAPMRPCFAGRGENLASYRAPHRIARPVGTKASMPSGEPRLGATVTSFQTRPQKLKSP
jgi:hypothetical protein